MNQFQTTTSAPSRSLSSPRPSYDVSDETIQLLFEFFNSGDHR